MKSLLVSIFMLQFNFSTPALAEVKCAILGKISKERKAELNRAHEKIQKNVLYKFISKELGEAKSCSIEDQENAVHTYKFSDGSTYINKWMTGEMSVDTTDIALTKPMDKIKAQNILSDLTKAASSSCKIKWDKSCIREKTKAVV